MKKEVDFLVYGENGPVLVEKSTPELPNNRLLGYAKNKERKENSKDA